MKLVKRSGADGRARGPALLCLAAMLLSCTDDESIASAPADTTDTVPPAGEIVETPTDATDNVWDTLLDVLGTDATPPSDAPVLTDALPPDVAPGNAAPVIEILAPTGGQHVTWNSPVTLRAHFIDDVDAASDLHVVWSSPIQGSVFDGAPDAQGMVEVTTSALVLGQHVFVVSATDTDGATATATVTVWVDPADGAPVLALAPPTPNTLDDLVASITDYKLVAGTSALTVSWSWFKGPDSVDVTADTISADLTAKGETWRVQATVSNGVEITPPGVSQVTIGNAAPSCPDGAAITLGTAGAVCGCASRLEPDAGDPALDRCAWTSGAEPVGTASCALDLAGIGAGSTLRCALTPSDGEDDGATVDAPLVVVPDAQGNTPPTAPGVTLTPPFGQPEHTFTCSLGTPSVDAQGDSVSYTVAWSVNGYWNTTSALTTASGSVVPKTDLVTQAGAAAAAGDVVRCRIIASDGTASSAPGLSQTVTLGSVGLTLGGGLGDVALDEPLGDGCFKATGHELPDCALGAVCAVDITACFAPDGSLTKPVEITAQATVPGAGAVTLTGTSSDPTAGFCLSGAVPDLAPPTVPLPMTSLTYSLCRDAAGQTTSGLSGQIALDGERYPFVNAALPAAVTQPISGNGGAGDSTSRFSVPVKSFLLDGNRFSGTLSFGLGASDVTFAGTVTIADIGAVTVSGDFSTAGGALTAGTLAASGSLSLKGVTFDGGATIVFGDGAWRLEVSGGALTLPGGQTLTLSGGFTLVAGQLAKAELDAGAGVTFAGVPFAGAAKVRWEKSRFALSLAGGQLGPNGPTFTLDGAVDVEGGEVVGGELSAGTDLVIAGVHFGGTASVTWKDATSSDATLRVALHDGLIALPSGAELRLAGDVVLTKGGLTSAAFQASGAASVAGVTFGGDVTASWAGADAWSVALTGGHVGLPGGADVVLSGALAVTGGRVTAGAFTAGTNVAFAGIAFSGAATGAYSAEYDDVGALVSERLRLGLSGGHLALPGGQSLTLAGDVEIEGGAVRSASLDAGADVSIAGVTFAGAARIVFTAPNTLALVLDGGQLALAGQSLVLSGQIGIDAGALACGEFASSAAVKASIGGVAFDLGVRFAGANRTCTWHDGTQTVSTEARLVASLSGGAFSVGTAQFSLAGSATVDGGTLACADLKAAGGASMAIAGVSFAAGARYAAPGASCGWTPSDSGMLELTLEHGVVHVGAQTAALSGAATLTSGGIASASFSADLPLTLPGSDSPFSVSGTYVAATDVFTVTLGSGEVVVAGTTASLGGSARVENGRIACVALSSSATASIGGATLTVGGRFSAAGASCPWSADAAVADTFEVTLAGSATLGGVTAEFSGVGRVQKGMLPCAELTTSANVSLPIGGAGFKAGLRLAGAGATCAWDDGTTTTATKNTLLASLRGGTLDLGGASVTLSGTGELEGGELSCAELRADAGASFDVVGVRFGIGARYAAAGATCAWSDGPSAANTLEVTLHDGEVAVGASRLSLSGTAEVQYGQVQCARLTLDSQSDLAFGGIAFSGAGRFMASGATCDGQTAGADTLELTLSDGHVVVAGQSVTLSGVGRVTAGALDCASFTASGTSPTLGGATAAIGGQYAAAGASCPGQTAPSSDDTFGLTVALSAGPLSMSGLGRVEGGVLSCAELNTTGGGAVLAGVSFDVGGRYRAAGHSCEWLDGSAPGASDHDVFTATLRNGTLAVGDQTLALSGEGELSGGAITCATLQAVGGVNVDVGGVAFGVGARYAAAGTTCGWSDGSMARLQVTLDHGQVTVGSNTVSLSGSAELKGRKLACAQFVSSGSGQVGGGQAGGAQLDLGGITFDVGARYAAAGEACGWSDGAAERFELSLGGGTLTLGSSTFTLAGGARLENGSVACAELTSTGKVALGGTTFAVGGRFTGAGHTCTWSDGTASTAAADTFRVTLRDGSVTIAGSTVALSGLAEVRGGKLACATLDAGGKLDLAIAGVSFGLGGARWAAAGQTCTWPDGTSTTATADTFRVVLKDGQLAVGSNTLTLSGDAELTAGKLTCASLTAGVGATIALGGVSFAAGARFAAAGSTCGWSGGAKDTLEVTLDHGLVTAGGQKIELSGASQISGGKLTCADFHATTDVATLFGGVPFTVGGRFAAVGQTCGWSDGSGSRFDVTFDGGTVAIGPASVSLSGSGSVVGGKLACAELTSGVAGAVDVGGLAFDVSGRFAAAGQTCPWASAPAAKNTFELALTNGSLSFGAGTLALNGAGTVSGGHLACAELAVAGSASGAGSASADVFGVSFELGARYAAAGESCTWADGATTTGAGNALLLALKNGTLAVGAQSLTLSGTATLVDGSIACATFDALGSGSVSVGGLSFDAGARYAAAGHACPWTDGPVPEHRLELTLKDGTVRAGDVALTLSGAADIVGGAVTCASLDVAGGAPAFGGLNFQARARFAAGGASCGWPSGSSDRLELLLDGASVSVGSAQVGLSGSGVVEAGRVQCVTFAGTGQAALGGLTFDVGARFAAAGATCPWLDPQAGPIGGSRFEVTLGGASVTLDGGVAVALSGAGRVDGGKLSCAELGGSGHVAIGGVQFDVGARYARAGATCTWANGTSETTTASALTLTLNNGSLAAGGVTLNLSGAARLSKGAITCAELDADGSASTAVGLDLAGVHFAAGAQYVSAGSTCTWRDGTSTTDAQSTLRLALKNGAVSVGQSSSGSGPASSPALASLVLSGTADIAAGKITCGTFQVAAGAGATFGGIGFDAGARYAAAGQTCGWSDGSKATLALTLDHGTLDLGQASVVLAGDATISGGAVTCAHFASTSAATASIGGISVRVGARYARKGASCDGQAPADVDSFRVTLDDGQITLGSATLALSGSADVAGGRLTCAELAAAGGAAADLGGITFDANVRYATSGSSCTWSDGTSTQATQSQLLLGLRNGELRVGATKLNLRGTGTLVGGRVACAELDAAGASELSLGGVSFDAGARYAAAGEACTWADGTTHAASPQTLEVTLKNGAVTVNGAATTLAGAGRLEGGQLACAELSSTGKVDLAGVSFAAGARYVGAGRTCTWRDGTSTTATAARFDLTLDDGAVTLDAASLHLSGTGSIVGGKLACAQLSSVGGARASVGGVSFAVGARFAAAGASCPWSTESAAASTFGLTLNDATLAVAGAGTLGLAGTATVVGGRLTCASLAATGQVSLAGVSFGAGARFTAAGATCPWGAAQGPKGRLDLTLDHGALAVGPTTLSLSGAATLVGSRLTCAELSADSATRLSLGDVSFKAGARFAAANETCVYSDGSVGLPSKVPTLGLRLSDGHVAVGDTAVTLAGGATIAGGQLTCAELAAGADVPLGGVTFDGLGHYARQGATCEWLDGTSTIATDPTFVLALRHGRLTVGDVTLQLSGEGTLVGTTVTCVALHADGQAAVALDGVSFDLGARFSAKDQVCPWGTAPADRFEVTLEHGTLTVGASTVTLAGTATLEGKKLTCAELSAVGNATVDLAGTTFDVGARFAAAHASCTWPDGTATAPVTDTLAVRLSGQLAVAGQTMAVSGTGLLEGSTVACAELAASGGFTDVSLGGVSFETGARYAAAGKTCAWADGSTTVAPTSTYSLQLALRNGAVDIAVNHVILSGYAEMQGGKVSRAELASSGTVAIAGVSFSVSASYDAAANQLVLTLHEGKLEAGFTTLTLSGSGVVDTASHSVSCLRLSAAGTALANFAGVTFSVGARYAAAGATCDWSPSAGLAGGPGSKDPGPATNSTFEATLDDGTLTLPGGSTVTVSGTGTIEAGRVTCATLRSAGNGGVAGASVGFDGTARYAAKGQTCGWRDVATEAAISVDLRTTLTVGPNVLTLVGAGNVGASGVDCAQLEVTGDVSIAGVTFGAGARYVAQGATCVWPDGRVSLPGNQRVEVVLDHGQLSFGGTTVSLSGLASAEKTDSGYVVPCLSLDAQAAGGWPTGGIAFAGSARFTSAGRQCAWDSAPASAHTLTLSLDDGALDVGVAKVRLSGGATVAGAKVSCLELASATKASGFGDLAFDVGGRFAAKGATCTWSDGTTDTASAQTFTAWLRNGQLTVGGQSVALSGGATVSGGTVQCAGLHAAGDVSVSLATTSFKVGGHYAAAGSTCAWLSAPSPKNTFTVALDGQLKVDTTTLALSGDATLSGGAVACASFTSSGDVPLGGLTFAGGARYAAAGAPCGWNAGVTGERLQVGLSGATLALGPTTLGLSGFADLVSGRLDCAELAVSGDLAAAFGGVQMSGSARYAGAGKTCQWKSGGSTTGKSFELALAGAVDAGNTQVALAGTAAITGSSVSCIDFSASGKHADLAGLDATVSATWAAPNQTCGPISGQSASTFVVSAAGSFTVGTATAAVSGSGTVSGGAVQCLDLSANGNTTIPLGDLTVGLAARFAKGGATCTWNDQTTSAPAVDTLFARLSGQLQVGGKSLALSGNGLVAGGKIACAELAADGTLDVAGVTFAAGARYSGPGQECTWSDGTVTPAPAADTLRVALDKGTISVGGASVTLSGEAQLDAQNGIACAAFNVAGGVSVGGITFDAAGHYAAANAACGDWDTTDASELTLEVRNGTLNLGGNTLSLSGALTVTNGKVTSGAFAATGAVALAGLSISALPGKPAASIAYTAAYDGAGKLSSQSLVLTLDGQVTLAGVGTFTASGSGEITNGSLDAITLSLGGALTLSGVDVSAEAIELVYQRKNPAAGGAATLELSLTGGQLAITGLGTLAVSGHSQLTAGLLTRLRLDVATDLTLADVTVHGGASLLYIAASKTLTLTLDQATTTIAGLGTLTLSGSSTLTAGVLDALDLGVTGELTVAGAHITGAATLEYRREDPVTLAPSVALVLDQASLIIDPLGAVSASGELRLSAGALSSFELAVTTKVALAGVPLSGGASIRYDAATQSLRFAVDHASVTIAGLGSLTVSGSAEITAGKLSSLTLAADGGVTLAGVAIAGRVELLYTAGSATLTLAITDGTVTIAGLDASLQASGYTSLVGGRLTALSLSLSGAASFQGIALSGGISLDYIATFTAAGVVASRSLSLSLSNAQLIIPTATVQLAGRLSIEGGAIACADLGPASVVLSGVAFEAGAYYIATGKTCGRLATAAPAPVFSATFSALIDVMGHAVSVTGSAAIANGRVDTITLDASVDLTGLAGLQRASVSGAYTGGTLCLAGDVLGTLVMPLGAELKGISASFCAAGASVSSIDLYVHVIAPNLVGEPLDMLAKASYSGQSGQLEAGLCLAGTDAQGAACCAGASDSCPSTVWHPFSGGVLPGLPAEWGGLEIKTLSGKVSIGKKGLGIDAIGLFDASKIPAPIPGLSLKELAVSLSASVGSTTAASAGIRGLFTLPLGEQPVDVAVAGTFVAGGGAGLKLTLSGQIGDPTRGTSADVEPLRQFIGDNTFEISYLTVEVTAGTAGVSFKLGGGANVTLPPPVSIGPIGLQLEGLGSLGKNTGFYLKGAICGIVLPAGLLPAGFDALPLGGPSPCTTPTVAVALATRAYPEVLLAPNTPVRRGLTLAATIKAPRAVLAPLGLSDAPVVDPSNGNPAPGPLGLPAALPGMLPTAGPILPTVPSVVAAISVDTSGVRLKGAINLPWQIIRPDWNLPAIHLLQLNEVAFEVLLSSSPTLMFTGSVLFQPNHCIPDYKSFVEAGLASDQSPLVAFDPSKITCLDLPAPFRAMPQQTVLKGTASFRYKPPKEFGGEISLQGLWYEPFWMPNLAIASPGLSVDIRLIDGPYGVQIPVPTSLGVNGDVFCKRPYYDDASAKPVYPVHCTIAADCTGYGTCAGGACPVECVDGADPDLVPDTCRYTWPYTCGSPDPAHPDAACIDTLHQPADVPGSLASSGVTLFYDVYPSSSGLFGLPLPTLIVRRELNHLNPLDIIPAVDELKDGARSLLRWMETRMPGLSPDLSPLPPCVDLDGDGTLDKSLTCLFPEAPLPNVMADLPITVQLDRARIYFSTHERDVFGTTFSPGVRADLDMKMTDIGAPTCDAATPCKNGLTCDAGTCKRIVFLSGGLSSDGLSLEGRASPLSLLDVVTLKGDPFTKFADMSGGDIEVPADPALEAQPGTVEGWVRHTATAPNQWQTVVRQVGAAGDGYELQVGGPELSCTARTDQCSNPCGQGGAVGHCSVCPAGATAPCDLPCATDAECHGATGDPAATCLGYSPRNTDFDVLAKAKSRPGFDLGAAMSAAGTACPVGDLACTTAGIRAAVAQASGSAFGGQCAPCLANFVTCEPKANARVNVLRGGAVTRTVRTSGSPVATNDWSHVAARFDEVTDDIALFVDGKPAATLDTSGRPDCAETCACNALCASSPLAVECAGCAAKLNPKTGSKAAAVAAVAQSCGTCQADQTSWLAGASAAGYRPTPGAGATLTLGQGVASLDDVRIWSGKRTPEQLASHRSSLSEDATPEVLGNCSNAGPGKCSTSNRSCQADFDCNTGSCVGAIPRGTCRTDADCTGGALCYAYVPPTQRPEFDTSLLARYEFDFDSYKSALGRAWNSRYRGDPNGLDCTTTPQLPPTATCGLIGTPCRDYDVDSSFKLHGHYAGGAHWQTAIDAPGGTHADDLLFKLNVPFGAEILKKGGLWIRGGVAFTFPAWLMAPDLLSNGGARVDVALSTAKEAHGELYSKPFDYLSLGLCQASTQRCTTSAECHDPLFGLDSATFCRDDGYCTLGPCLGRLTLSGYGPNGIDDGIDDGFYARTNLLSKPLPTLQAGARASVETFATPREDLAFASYDLSCPAGQNCQSAGDYRLSLATGLQLDVPLPFELDPSGKPTHLLKICGNAATYKPGKGDETPGWVAAASDLCPVDGQVPSFGTFVDGSLDVLGQTFNGSAILSSCGFRIHSGFDVGKVTIGDFSLPSLGVMDSDVMGRFVPFRVCSSGYLSLNLQLPYGSPAKLLDLTGDVTTSVCVGEATKYPTRDSGQYLQMQTGAPNGAPTEARARFFALDDGASLFEMAGLVDICAGDGDKIGQPGVLNCADNHLKLCGNLSLLGDLVKVENKCIEFRVPHFDVTFSLHSSVTLDLAGVLPSSNSQIFIEMCPKGQNAEWSEAQGKVICVAHANPAFKMNVPLVMLRFKANLDVARGSFGNLDVNLFANFSGGLKFAGSARYTAGTSTAFGLNFWGPSSCDLAVSLDVPIGGTPHLVAGSPRCEPYCVVDSDCSEAGATCNLGKCERCGNGTCAFGENSLTCPVDCGYIAGSDCSSDAVCASKSCWTVDEQIKILVDLGIKKDPGVCLPCVPGTNTCGPNRYCDGFQLFECRDKAPYGVLCAYNEVCQSGMCQFDLGWGGARCADCNSDSQCAAGSWCDMSSTITPPSGPAYQCRPPAGLGEKCGIGGPDSRCQGGLFCDIDGLCHQKAGNGIACIRDGVCGSSHCCGGICQACCTKADCGAGLGCYGYTCRKGNDGEACVEDAECGSGICVQGICTTPGPVGTACFFDDRACQSHHCCGVSCQACCTAADCAPGLGCYDYTCKKTPDGLACTADAECASNKCVVGICTTPVANGVSCGADGACQSGHCCGGICQGCCAKVDCGAGLGCYGNTCRKGNDGEACVEGAECASGTCAAGICTTRVPNGTLCGADAACQSNHCCALFCQECCTKADCGDGYGCYNYVCRKANNGEACAVHNECASGLCSQGYCRALGESHMNAYCEAGWWCLSGSCAYSGKHIRNVCFSYENLPGGAGCDVSEECQSGKCEYAAFGWIKYGRPAGYWCADP